MRRPGHERGGAAGGGRTCGFAQIGAANGHRVRQSRGCPVTQHGFVVVVRKQHEALAFVANGLAGAGRVRAGQAHLRQEIETGVQLYVIGQLRHQRGGIAVNVKAGSVVRIARVW